VCTIRGAAAWLAGSTARASPAQGAQAQIHIAKADGQGFIEAVDFFKGVAAHQEAGGGHGGDLVGNDQAAHVADINAVGWQAQKFAVVFGNAKSAYADACMLDAGAVRIEQLGTDDAYIGLLASSSILSSQPGSRASMSLLQKR
jgi:hypothetical protein